MQLATLRALVGWGVGAATFAFTLWLFTRPGVLGP